MKFSLICSLAAGLATALNTPSIGVLSYEGEHTLHAADKPANSPADYDTGLSVATVLRSTEGLLPLPANIQRRQEGVHALRRLRRQSNTQDFFECANANPAPTSADCAVIVKNVLATGNDLIVDRGSCLIFSYRTCTGFFCSLCDPLTTSTDFIGMQLDTVDALCVAGGQAGTIVGEGAPQYEVGFVRSGSGLPNYDVCH